MTTMRTRVLGLVMATGLAVTAAQAVPPAVDRVPADTPVVIGVQSLSGFLADAQQWIGTLAPPEAAMGLMMVEQILQTPGLNPDGSAAVALTFPDGPANSEPVPVIILPVADFAALAESMEGNAADGVTALNVQGETVFAKDLGGGFMALGPVMELVEGFNGSAGKANAHEARLGAQAAKAADEADVFLIVDVQSMRPVLDEGLAEMEQEMEFAAMMAGEAAAAQMEAFAGAAKAVVHDGRTAFLGLGAGEDGLWFDFAGQFAEGSDTAGIFAGGGDTAPLFAALPNMDYVFAMAFDSTSPGIRQFMAAAAKLSQGTGMAFKTDEMIELTSGSAMVFGTTPALLTGGMFSNTVAFTATSDPDAMLEAMKTGIGAMDGQGQEGILFHTTWTDDATEVAGHSLDGWGLAMEGDPNHPNGAQAGMMLQQMAFLFGGQGGPAGYVATTDKGLYTTYSKNSKLMERVLTGGENSLAANEALGAVAGHLPDDCTAEGYINVKGILDMFVPMLTMFGVAPDLGDLPESMNPIGIGLATGDGGMHARVFVPGDVLQFIATAAEQMNAGDEWEEIDEEPDSKPRF